MKNLTVHNLMKKKKKKKKTLNNVIKSTAVLLNFISILLQLFKQEKSTHLRQERNSVLGNVFLY